MVKPYVVSFTNGSISLVRDVEGVTTNEHWLIMHGANAEVIAAFPVVHCVGFHQLKENWQIKEDQDILSEIQFIRESELLHRAQRLRTKEA